MSKRVYHPERGDLVLMNFHPAAAREIVKRRPAVILSPLKYNRATGFCLTAPITSDMTPGPLWLPLPDGLLDRPSQILCDRIRSFDYRERSVTSLDQRLPPQLLNQIVDNILDLIDPA